MLIRLTEQALDRSPERTVALVRSRLERLARDPAQARLHPRTLAAATAVRLIDVHPVVAERVVRLWLKQARRRAVEESRDREVRRGPSSGSGGRTR